MSSLTRYGNSGVGIEHLKRAAAGRWGEVFGYYGVEPRRGHVRCPLPHHDDRHPSFRVDVEQGRYFCSCGAGDAIDFVAAMCDVAVPVAARQIADLLLVGPGETPEELRAIAAAKEGREAHLRRIDAWHSRGCDHIGARRRANGPEPVPAGSARWWDWARTAARIDTAERWLDYLHSRGGEGYVRGADRFDLVRLLLDPDRPTAVWSADPLTDPSPDAAAARRLLGVPEPDSIQVDPARFHSTQSDPWRNDHVGA